MQTLKLSSISCSILFGCVLTATHSNLQAAASQEKAPSVGLQSATVMDVKNELTILAKDGSGERKAGVHDTVKLEVLRTGKDSHAELVFKDHSVVRLGANTIFSFDPASRNMWVQEGTAMIHVPPGLGGASIHTPESTTQIRGDTVMLTTTATATQVAVLSKDPGGPVTVTSTGSGVSQPVNAGQIMGVSTTGSTKPINFSVDALTQSSGLLTRGFSAALPATAQNEIQQTLLTQNKQIQNGNLGFSGNLVQINNTSTTINPIGSVNNNSVVQDQIAAAAVIPTVTTITPTTVVSSVSFAGTYTFPNTVAAGSLTINPNNSFTISVMSPLLFANFSGNINANGSIGNGTTSFPSATNTLNAPIPNGTPLQYQLSVTDGHERQQSLTATKQ